MQNFDRRTWNPNQMNGQPCIRDMRLTVRRVLEAIAVYPNRDDLFRDYPELEPEDVRQALEFAAANLEDTATESNASAMRLVLDQGVPRDAALHLQRLGYDGQSVLVCDVGGGTSDFSLDPRQAQGDPGRFVGNYGQPPQSSVSKSSTSWRWRSRVTRTRP